MHMLFIYVYVLTNLSNKTKTYTDPKKETDQRKFRILTSRIVDKEMKTDKFQIHKLLNEIPKKRNKAEESSSVLLLFY